MAAGHGGSRTGSGRKAAGASESTPKAPTPYPDALSCLSSVVTGVEPADALRIAAARIVLPFQQPKARAPVESPPPRALRKQAVRADEQGEADDWQRRAAAVRRKLKGASS